MATSMENSAGQIAPGSNHPQDQQPNPTQQYRFTNDEMRVLKQCNRDSFFQRSLPIGTALGVGTYLGVQSGYIKGHTRWGPTPKVMIAATIGYFIGKFSYQTICAEKLMQLENSPLGDMLRKRKQTGRGGFNEGISLDPSFGSALPPLPGVGPQEVYSELGPRHDLDSDRPYMPGLSENNMPTPDSSFLEEDTLPEHPPSHTTTYEELRRKNREEYEQKKNKQYRVGPGSEDTGPPPRPRQDYPSGPPSPAWNKEKNKYGDTWDE